MTPYGNQGQGGLGSGISPALFLHDYSGFTDAARTQAAGMAGMVGQLAQAGSDVIQQRKQAKQEILRSKKTAQAIATLIPELEPQVKQSISFLDDEENPLSDRYAAAKSIDDLLSIGREEIRAKAGLSLQQAQLAEMIRSNQAGERRFTIVDVETPEGSRQMAATQNGQLVPLGEVYGGGGTPTPEDVDRALDSNAYPDPSTVPLGELPDNNQGSVLPKNGEVGGGVDPSTLGVSGPSSVNVVSAEQVEAWKKGGNVVRASPVKGGFVVKSIEFKEGNGAGTTGRVMNQQEIEELSRNGWTLSEVAPVADAPGMFNVKGMRRDAPKEDSPSSTEERVKMFKEAENRYRKGDKQTARYILDAMRYKGFFGGAVQMEDMDELFKNGLPAEQGGESPPSTATSQALLPNESTVDYLKRIQSINAQ